MNRFWIAPFLVGLFFMIPSIDAETLVQNLEGGMDIEITHPEEIVVGREGIVSILVKITDGKKNKIFYLNFHYQTFQD